MPNNDILTKLKSTADILGGAVFFATDNGADPEFSGVNDLLPNGMYIRLEGSDGSLAYISAYEIDKALSIIGDMSINHASKSDVDELRNLVNEKTSTIQFDLLKSEVDDKADKSVVDDLLYIVDDKADKSVVDNIETKLKTKGNQTDIDRLAANVENKADKLYVETIEHSVSSKANQSSLDTLVNDINALKSIVNTMSDSNSIDVINKQIAYLKSELNSKLTKDDLYFTQNDIQHIIKDLEVVTYRLDTVENDVNKRATKVYVQQQVSELNNALTGLAKKVDNKADKNAITEKADKNDLEAVVKKLTSLNTRVNNIETNVDDNYNTLYVSLNDKADKSYLDTSIEQININVTSKADKTSLADAINRIDNKLNIIEETHTNDNSELTGDIENIEHELNNAISSIGATLETHAKQINNQTTQINSLKQTDNQIAEQLKQQWVRVMTPEEYNYLAPVGSSSINAKQANTLYMLVRYNKPIAVYIGDVLIAKAEQTGSVGFAYTFPIVF